MGRALMIISAEQESELLYLHYTMGYTKKEIIARYAISLTSLNRLLEADLGNLKPTVVPGERPIVL